MTKEEFKALLSSLARIELLIVTNMKAKYGEKTGRDVYDEVIKAIDEAWNEEVN